MKNNPFISIIIPAKNEVESITPLYNELINNLKKITSNFEIIFIDDGSTDKTVDKILSLRKKDKKIKLIELRGWHGKSIALQSGFESANGEIIITMDADLQDSPEEISKFIKKINEGYDLVSGWKKVRHDPLSKTVPSKIGNTITRLLTGIKIHDLNCGFKAYRSDVVKNINLYGELYKYIPVIVEKQNYKVTEIVVKHKKRRFGYSKFGWSRNVKGFLDMLTIVFITGYLKRPGHFFGTAGFISFFAGFLIGIYITYLRFTTGSIQYHHPLLFLGILLIMVGIQLITTGLLAEMMININEEKKTTKAYVFKKYF